MIAVSGTGAFPKALQFFRGGENEQLQKNLKCLGWGKNGKIVDYLESEEFHILVRHNKMSILIDIRNIFFDNINSGESIFDFIASRQDYDEKLLQIEFNYSDNCDSYIFEFLKAIKSVNNDKCDIQTNKNSKFLFYNFNQS